LATLAPAIYCPACGEKRTTYLFLEQAAKTKAAAAAASREYLGGPEASAPRPRPRKKA